MRLLVCATTILLAGAAWAQQMCNPVCAEQPKECCGIQGGDLLYECSVQTAPPAFVISDGAEDDLFSVKGLTASFSVAGLAVNNLTIGNVTFAPFTIGSSNTNVRFTTSLGGQCVGVSNFKGFVNPGAIVVQNRALHLLMSNPFFCREPARDIICFQVTGQVRGPFPTNLACTPDRVEYACGTVI
jgi:hypothetical protein